MVAIWKYIHHSPHCKQISPITGEILFLGTLSHASFYFLQCFRRHFCTNLYRTCNIALDHTATLANSAAFLWPAHCLILVSSASLAKAAALPMANSLPYPGPLCNHGQLCCPSLASALPNPIMLYIPRQLCCPSLASSLPYLFCIRQLCYPSLASSLSHPGSICIRPTLLHFPGQLTALS